MATTPSHRMLLNPPSHRSLRHILLSMMALTLGLLVSLSAAAQSEARRDYVLGPGDVIRITVYQNPDLSLDTRVSETGVVSYPLLGALKLGGLSVPVAEKTIADGLLKGNYLKQPQVSILLVQVRGNQASVLGMVNRPGRYPIEVSGLRLTELLATAGGIAPGGSDMVTFTGTRNGRLVRRSFDIGVLLTNGKPEDDPVISDGDTLYVERMPMVYIYGEVQRPGSMRVERGMTVMQVLANGGGPTQRGTTKGLRINRRGADGKITEFEPQMTDPVQEADVVFVRQSLF